MFCCTCFRCSVAVHSFLGFEFVNLACVVVDAVMRLRLCSLQLLGCVFMVVCVLVCLVVSFLFLVWCA